MKSLYILKTRFMTHVHYFCYSVTVFCILSRINESEENNFLLHDLSFSWNAKSIHVVK